MWKALAANHLILTLGLTFGGVMLILAGLRSMLILLDDPVENNMETEAFKDPYDSYFVTGIVILILFGLFPQWLVPFVEELARAYPNIAFGF